METPQPRLRPMGLGDLIDEAIALYRRNFALFAGIAAVLTIPETVINVLLAVSRGSSMFTRDSSGHVIFHSGQLVGFAGASFGSIFVSFLFGALITGALANAISVRYLDRQTTIAQTYAAVGISTFVVLAIANIVSDILISIGFIFLVVPAVIFFVHFLFIPQVVVLERKGPFAALGRSWELVRGNFWRVFGIALVVYIIVAVIQGVVGGVAGALLAAVGEHSGVGSTIVGAIVTVLVVPFQLGALTLLYYDLRIRKEGFDLEYMAKALDTGSLA